MKYAGDEYFLRGTECDGKPSPPGITIACDDRSGGADAAIAKIYRFTSILSWFEGGYVDVSGYMWGSHPTLYGARTVYSSMGIAGAKSFKVTALQKGYAIDGTVLSPSIPLHCENLDLLESQDRRFAIADDRRLPAFLG
jgi:hypothetical protein